MKKEGRGDWRQIDNFKPDDDSHDSSALTLSDHSPGQAPGTSPPSVLSV
jgi:hypothetical protein